MPAIVVAVAEAVVAVIKTLAAIQSALCRIDDQLAVRMQRDE